MEKKKDDKLNILIVDDSKINRVLLKNMLKDEFEILEASDGIEAINVLNTYQDKVSLILLDIVMPRMNGFDVLQVMNTRHWIEDIPVMIISAEASSEYVKRTYDLGVMDYINRDASPMIIRKRVSNTIRLFSKQKKMLHLMEMQNEQLMEQNQKMHYIDELTGCLNFEGFKLKALKILRSDSGKKYAITFADIKHFKFINDEFGYEAGDRLIRRWAEIISNDMKEGEVCARVSADNMVALNVYENAEELTERIQVKSDQIKNFFNGVSYQYEIEIAVGIYLINENDIKQRNISRMLDCANIAQKSIKSKNGSRVAFYNDSLWDSQVREQEICRYLRDSMEQRKIRVWFQPQYDYNNGKIIGAEALSRWEHPTLGEISPGEYIPILEKNSLIFEFDRYIWEESCRYIRRWMDLYGKRIPASFSVNVSRLDMGDLVFYSELEKLIEKYHIPRKMLHLEITEGAYMGRPEKLIEVVKHLQIMGYIVEMDDFGSGFSSLNMLKDVPVDILKIDMRFLDDAHNSFRGGMILNSVIRMAGWLDIPVIAEGVETKEQADFLKNMGCNLMQGYFFSRPLSAEKFEMILKESLVETVNYNFQGDGLYNIAEFLDSRSNSSFIFNDCIGGAILLEFSEENVSPILVNDAFFDVIGICRSKCKKYRNHLIAFFDDANARIAINTLKEAGEKGMASSELFIDQSAHWISCSCRCLSSGTKGYIIFALVEDVSNQHAMEAELRHLEKEQWWRQTMCQKLTELPGMITYDYDPATDCCTIHVSLKEGGMKEIIVEHFFENLHNQDWLDPDTADTLGAAYKESLEKNISGTVDFKGRFFGEEYRWIRSYYTSVADDQGKVYRIVGRADDIEEDVQITKSWKEKAQKDTMTNLLNHDAAKQKIAESLKQYGGGSLLLLDVDDFKKVNDVLGHLYGDEFLQNVADAIRSQFRKGDIVGRFGGDEFIMFMPGIQDEEIVKKRARNILDKIRTIEVPELDNIPCSIGIAIANSAKISSKELFAQADGALYYVKQTGKGKYAVYNEDMGIKPRMEKEENN